MDRYGLAREFELQKFEMQIMKCEDLYALQTLCVKLFAQTKAQQSVYESMLRDMGKLRRRPEPITGSDLDLRTCGDDRYSFRSRNGFELSGRVQTKKGPSGPLDPFHLVLEFSEELGLLIDVLSDQLCEASVGLSVPL